MSTHKITPGPWNVHGAKICRDTSPSREVIALVCGSDANARLIAAAPELLKTLANLCDRIDTIAQALTSKGHADFVSEWLDDKLIDNTRATIARAKGE